MCLQPELEQLVANVVPEEQQGFWRGGRIYAAYLALHALIEGARISGERLYVAFVDVRRAFPSVRRDILWRKLSALGASDHLVRALVELYTDAQGTVRGAQGLSGVFDITLGTREGGVESPLLYVLFVADLIAHLDEATLLDGSACLDGKAVRGLQLADDLALIAKSERDLNTLLEQWGGHCDRSHQVTQTKKTEMVAFALDRDAHLRIKDGAIQLGRRRPMQFRYRDFELKVSESFVYFRCYLIGARGRRRPGRIVTRKDARHGVGCLARFDLCRSYHLRGHLNSVGQLWGVRSFIVLIYGHHTLTSAKRVSALLMLHGCLALERPVLSGWWVGFPTGILTQKGRQR